MLSMPVIRAASADCTVRAFGEPIAHPQTLVRAHYSHDVIGTPVQAATIVTTRERAMSPQEYRLQPATTITEVTENEESPLDQLGSRGSQSGHTGEGSVDVSCASLEQSQDAPPSPSGSARQEEERKTERQSLRSIKEGETHMDREAKLFQRREEREKLRKRREAEKSDLGPDELRDCTFRPVLCRDHRKVTGRTRSVVSPSIRTRSPNKSKPLVDRQRTALQSLRVLSADEALLRKKIATMEAEIQERFREADQLRAQRATLVEELEAVEEEAATVLGDAQWQQAAVVPAELKAAKGVEFGLARVARRSLPAGPALSQTSTASSGEAF